MLSFLGVLLCLRVRSFLRVVKSQLSCQINEVEPAVAVFVRVHGVRLVHFVRVVLVLGAEVYYLHLGKLVDFVLQHRVQPVEVVQVVHTLFLYVEFVIVFYGPHVQGLDVGVHEVVRLLTFHLLELGLGLLDDLSEGIFGFVEGNNELFVLIAFLFELVVNPHEGKAAILNAVLLNDIIDPTHFIGLYFIQSQDRGQVR